MQSFWRFYCTVLFLCTSLIVFSGEVIQLRTADKTVISVVISAHISEGPPGQDPFLWSVNGETPVQVGRFSYVWYQEPDINDMFLQHHIYLELEEPLLNGTTYVVETPGYGTHDFIFNDEVTLCEAIHVNQVGYFGGSPSVRYGVMGVYLGDLGSRQLSPIPGYNVLNQDGEEVVSGTLVYWGDDTGGVTGEHVYRIDLSEVPDGGPYIISVEGYGCSYPFGVGQDYVNQATYVQVRGLYHARCGIELEEPYTEFTHDVCHPTMEITEATPPVSGDALINDRGPERPVSGGYHDAADYDHRAGHTLIPAMMFTLYEAFPDGFQDNQYNIPESGNGIPDWLDEALFGMKIWEELQEEDGGIRAGKETNAYPNQGVDKADTDPLIYRTYRRYGYTTAMGAGLFAHASRLIQPFDADRAAELLDKAVSAWNYLLDNEDENPDMASASVGTRMYATLQLYLTTEDEEYHNLYKDYASSWISSGDGYLGGNLGSTHGPSIFSYLITELPKDDALANTLTNRISSRANIWLDRLASQPYPIVTIPNYSWGSASAQGRYSEPLIYMYRLTNDDRYLDGVSEMYNFALGLNPLNRSFTTGLGINTPTCTRSHDSYWFYKEGKGDIPGITVYGIITEPAPTRTEVADQVYPEWNSLPRQKRFSDGWNFLRANEWTVTETISQNAVMYAFLSAVGGGDKLERPDTPENLMAVPVSDKQIDLSWNDVSANADLVKIERRLGENYREIAIVPASENTYSDKGLLPNTLYTYHIQAYNAGGYSSFSGEVFASTEELGTNTGEELVNNYSLKIFPNPFSNAVQLNYSIASGSKVNLKIMDLTGRTVKTLVNKTQDYGSYSVTWNADNERGDRVSEGIYLCKITVTTQNGTELYSSVERLSFLADR